MSNLEVLIDVTERNTNHIIPSYCYLPVSCRNLVHRCGSLGSCKSQIYYFFFFNLEVYGNY